ncbi:MAG: tetratricopeptide repeat protein [Planctomycetia bacterium]|nr:tetratricopeptide repeat protein [Planctomycetia bacterium]
MPSPTRKERPRGGPRQPARATAATGPLGRPAWAAVALVGLVVLTYVPVYRAGFVWDDDQYVTENLPLRSWPGLAQLWFEPGAVPQYYPLVYTTFWIEYHLWGLAPLGYHAVNVLLHAVNALLVWRLLCRLGVPGAWLAAALFAVHPVHVESVAWVTERKNVLSLALALSSMLCYLRFAPWMAIDEGESPGARRYYYWALALFAVALLSKTAVVTLPAVLLVLCWWKRGAIARRDVVALAPFFALAVAMGLVTVWVESGHVQARGPQWHRGPVERLLIAGRGLWFYAGKLAWPYPVMFHYPRWTIDTGQWWQYVLPAAAVLVVVAMWTARKRIGRGPLAAALIFAGVLVPVLGFFNVYYTRYSFVADHFQYHASLGLIALAAAAAATAIARLSVTRRPIAYTAAGTVIAALAVLTARQANVYRNVETLLGDTIAKNPDGWIAYANLSAHLDAQGRLDEAGELAQKALRLNPDEALVQHNVGHILLSQSERHGFPPAELEESMRHLREAARLDPKCVEAYRGLGFALVQAKRPKEAREQFGQALAISPADAPSLLGMGSLASTSGNLAEAEDYFRRALAARPGYAKAHHALGVILSAQGRDVEAIEHLQAAVELDPAVAQAHYDLAGAWAHKGQLRLAAQEYAEAVKRRPAHYDAWSKLGQALEQLGDRKQAAVVYREALRLNPDAAEAQAHLERARGEARRDDATP